MTKSHVINILNNMRRAGISHEHAIVIRRCAMALHRWYELECGTESGCIERDEKTGKPYWLNSFSGRRTPTADRERAAEKRLREILRHYPELAVYLQTDPRGAPVYILRPGDIPAGADAESCYSNGIAVYK